MLCLVWYPISCHFRHPYLVVFAVLRSHRPPTIMSAISFPGQSSSSSPHDSLYPLSFDSASTSGFQMNPLSAHPPRTPRTSVTSPFSSHASAEKEEMEEHPNELEVELEEEEEENQEKSAAKTQVRAQEIWRDLLETSAGRDKTFVLHFTSPEITPTDCLWHRRYTENITIFYEGLLAVPPCRLATCASTRCQKICV